MEKQQSNRLINCKEVLLTTTNELVETNGKTTHLAHRREYSTSKTRRCVDFTRLMGRQPPEPETPPRLAGRLVLRLVPGVDVLAEVIVAVAEELRQRPRTIQPGDRLVQGGDVAPDVEAVVLHLEGSKSNSYTLLHNLRIKYFSISLEYLNKII